jgi:NAD(P)-dependent dehydrogenase (short-subunit alcohol dehydrogenase family)
VCVADIEFDEAGRTAARIGDGAFACKLDVTSLDSIDACVAETQKKLGGIDILVNAAAIFDMGPFPETTEKSYDRVFAVNVKGALFMMTAVSRAMIAQGRGGKIINFASQAGRRGVGGGLLRVKSCGDFADSVGGPCADQAPDQRQWRFARCG